MKPLKQSYEFFTQVVVRNRKRYNEEKQEIR